MADSIEWVTADSDRVVVGKVAKVVQRKAGSVTWHVVTISAATPTQTKHSNSRRRSGVRRAGCSTSTTSRDQTPSQARRQESVPLTASALHQPSAH